MATRDNEENEKKKKRNKTSRICKCLSVCISWSQTLAMEVT